MNRITTSPLLRLAIAIDGNASALLGLAAVLGTSSLAAGLGAPTAWVLAVSLFTLLYGVGMTVLAKARQLPVLLPWVLVIGNLGWVIASVALALSDWISPQPWALAVLHLQAGCVIIFSLLQYLGLRQSPASSAAWAAAAA